MLESLPKAAFTLLHQNSKDLLVVMLGLQGLLVEMRGQHCIKYLSDLVITSCHAEWQDLNQNMLSFTSVLSHSLDFTQCPLQIR